MAGHGSESRLSQSLAKLLADADWFGRWVKGLFTN